MSAAVVLDPALGYRHLDPTPTPAELGEFYQSRYYDLLRKGGRAPELRRLTSGGPEADEERGWLRETLWADVADLLAAHAPGKRVLDVGCGTGDLLSVLRERGFEGEGIELSGDAVRIARDRGLTARSLTAEALAQTEAGRFDAVTMLNVLEHVPAPAQLLDACRTLLGPGGALLVRVPNDFTELQEAARRKLGAEPWWVAAPDHVNYFDFASLAALLTRLGFTVEWEQGDFPMELLLLLGENYVAEPGLGARWHARRRDLERALPAPLRRRLYRALAQAGVGRNCLVLARRGGP